MKKRMPKFGTKNALLGYFSTGIRKKYCHIWNQRPWICLVTTFGAKLKILKFGTKSNSHLGIWKLREKIKMFKFWTQNTSIGYFWVRISKNCCHIWNQHPQICQLVKFREKTVMSKFGTKNVLFGYFWNKIF